MRYYIPPTCPRLQTYTYCRENNHKGALPAKGSIEENLGGVKKLVYIAHGVQMKPMLYKEQVESIKHITTMTMEEIMNENEKKTTNIQVPMK